MIQLFKCDYCKKTFEIKDACETHEITCKNNPIEKTCNTCCLFWIHRDSDETWHSCDKNLLHGDYMKNCEGWESESNRKNFITN